MNRRPKACGDDNAGLIAGYQKHKYLPLEFGQYADGTQQWSTTKASQDFFLERVLREKSMRKQWHIVNRSSPCAGYETALYPPKVAGPFPNAASALVAYLLYSTN
jgi:hypothetical protein